MAKATVKSASAKSQVINPVATEELNQIFKVTQDTPETTIVEQDGTPGVRLEFDYVHFKKLPESFVGNMKAHNQKAYWMAFSEFDSRTRQANIAMHSIGVDPMSKILDRPRGTSNPLVRDELVVKPLLPRHYVTWRIMGGEGDFESAIQTGFKVIRRPKDAEEKKTKSPLEWTGEIWKVRDGTVDPTSGDEIFNVMVCIEKQRWEDNLKAMSMASHNAYSQNKQQFFEGAENISRDMLGSKERIAVADLDELKIEEHTVVQEGKRVRVDPRE
jgi:hypothetical protein